MTTNDVEVVDLLRRASDDLVVPPDLLGRVRRGGRRRAVRRRVVLVAGMAMAVTVGVGTGFQLAAGGRATELSAPLLDQPTRGDLAADGVFLGRLTAAWRKWLATIGEVDLRGEPHVVWAGNTPAGPAAYLVQRSATNPVVSQPDGGRLVAEAGFVRSTGHGLQVMTLEAVTDHSIPTSAVLLGADFNVLVVLDLGNAVEFSPALRYTADGRIERTFQTLQFRDGAAVLTVPPQRTKVTVALSRTPVSFRNMVHIVNVSEILIPGGRDRPAPPQLTHILPGADRIWGSDPTTVVTRYVYDTDALAAFQDPGGTHTHNASPLLTVYGATPDGRRLLLQTLQFDDDPSRVVALLGRGDTPFQAVGSTVVDWNATLPVRIQLPDNQGIVVAAEGASLSYRVDAGGWQEAGRDAALLPSTATEVRLTRGGSVPATVPLTT
jgi:hypothetical protein